MTAVVLGVDPGARHLGLAVVEFEAPHRALWADTVSIDEPDGGWRFRQVRRELQAALNRLGPGYEVVRVGIEDPPAMRNAKVTKLLTRVAEDAEVEAHNLWPWAVIVPLSPPAWKKATVGKGNAPKPEVFAWAERWWGAASLLEGAEQDAADALGIAVAAAKVEIEVAA